MTDRAFIIQQIGAKDSPERKRADEIYNYVIAPMVQDASLEPYRADLDLSPGAITPKMLSELLKARLVVADLTGRNPNVFYELGITHSFARPLISIADSAGSLPFDAKDERVIELGEFPPSGLGVAQAEKAKDSLKESLKIVLDEGYSPASPLKEVATNQSVDDLAPDNPIAAELAQMRETLEEIRMRDRTEAEEDLRVLRAVIARNIGWLQEDDFKILSASNTSREQDTWIAQIRRQWETRPKLDDLERVLSGLRKTGTERPAWLAGREELEDPSAEDSGVEGSSDEPPC